MHRRKRFLRSVAQTRNALRHGSAFTSFASAVFIFTHEAVAEYIVAINFH